MTPRPSSAPTHTGWKWPDKRPYLLLCARKDPLLICVCLLTIVGYSRDLWQVENLSIAGIRQVSCWPVSPVIWTSELVSRAYHRLDKLSSVSNSFPAVFRPREAVSRDGSWSHVVVVARNPPGHGGPPSLEPNFSPHAPLLWSSLMEYVCGVIIIVMAGNPLTPDPRPLPSPDMDLRRSRDTECAVFTLSQRVLVAWRSDHLLWIRFHSSQSYSNE